MQMTSLVKLGAAGARFTVGNVASAGLGHYLARTADEGDGQNPRAPTSRRPLIGTIGQQWGLTLAAIALIAPGAVAGIHAARSEH